ncbi:SDR family oxidoreductase [Beduinella massiliensis]|uniref:SDR family oxidoreductase n=1 Tax=Beduinella massiliensis TaxID=1852363 RepID=UPI000C8484A3
MINPMTLSDKHILITGASSGIGRSTCILASQLGARVTLIGRNEERLRESSEQMQPGNHRYWIQDLSKIEEIRTLVKAIAKEQGAIDGLVHCAGIGKNRPIKMTKPEFIEENARIHYFAFAELLRCVSERGCYNEGASMLGISSIASIRGDRAQGAYAAAKGAMNALIHPYAKELAVKRIRLNTIAFGMVETEMYQEFKQSGGNDEELMRNQYLGAIPVENAAEVICFMLSDASRYMTGTNLIYDAGALS